MTCSSCLGARRAAREAAKAAVNRDLDAMAASAREAAGHLADKARAEAERIRDRLRRR